MRAVVYLKLGTGLTQTKTYTEHNSTTVHKTTSYWIWEPRAEVLGGAGGGAGLKPKDNEKSMKIATRDK